jgi:hypothetical protein
MIGGIPAADVVIAVVLVGILGYFVYLGVK